MYIYGGRNVKMNDSLFARQQHREGGSCTFPSGAQGVFYGKILRLVRCRQVRRIDLPNLAGKVDYAQFLHDGSEIRFTETLPGNIHGPRDPEDGALRLALPVSSPENCAMPVAELFLKD